MRDNPILKVYNAKLNETKKHKSCAVSIQARESVANSERRQPSGLQVHAAVRQREQGSRPVGVAS